MSTLITGIVTNGVVVTSTTLPEGSREEIRVPSERPQTPFDTLRISPSELRKLPRAERQTILAEAAMLAELDYREDKNLTCFDAFLEEEIDNDIATCVGAL